MDILIKDGDRTFPVRLPDGMSQAQIEEALRKFPRETTAKDVGSAAAALGAGMFNWIPEGLMKSLGYATGQGQEGIIAGEFARELLTPELTPGAERLLSPIMDPLERIAKAQPEIGNVAYEGKYPISELTPDVQMKDAPDVLRAAHAAGMETLVGGSPFVAIPAAIRGLMTPARLGMRSLRGIEQKNLGKLRESQRAAGTDMPVGMLGGDVYPEIPTLPSNLQSLMKAKEGADRLSTLESDAAMQERARYADAISRMRGVESQGEGYFKKDPQFISDTYGQGEVFLNQERPTQGRGVGDPRGYLQGADVPNVGNVELLYNAATEGNANVIKSLMAKQGENVEIIKPGQSYTIYVPNDFFPGLPARQLIIQPKGRYSIARIIKPEEMMDVQEQPKVSTTPQPPRPLTTGKYKDILARIPDEPVKVSGADRASPWIEPTGEGIPPGLYGAEQFTREAHIPGFEETSSPSPPPPAPGTPPPARGASPKKAPATKEATALSNMTTPKEDLNARKAQALKQAVEEDPSLGQYIKAEEPPPQPKVSPQPENVPISPTVRGKKVKTPTPETKTVTPKVTTVKDTLKGQKTYLLDAIDEAIKKVGEEDAPPKVRIEIPGDGTFEIINNAEVLENFKKSAKSGMPTGTEKVYDPFSQWKAPTSLKASGKRLEVEGVEYYNEFKPRERDPILDKGKDVAHAYTEGWYTQGRYAVKTEPTDMMKKVGSEMYQRKPDIKKMLETALADKPVPGQIVGEYFHGGVDGTVGAHLVNKNGAWTSIVAEHADAILTKHPKAVPYFTENPKLVLFVDKGKPVGAAAVLQNRRGDFYGNLKEQALEVMKEKGVPPPKFADEFLNAAPKEMMQKVVDGQITREDFINWLDKQKVPLDLQDKVLLELGAALDAKGKPGVTLEAAIIPGAAQAVEGIGKLWSSASDAFKKIFLPTARGESAMRIGEIISQHRAGIDRVHAIMDRTFQAAQREFSKYSPKDNYKFMQAMDAGWDMPPHLKEFGKQIEKLFEERRDAIREIDPNALKAVRNNYFPHIWDMKDPKTISWLERKSLEGSKQFLRDRAWTDINQGLAAGAKPLYDNPIMAVKAKVLEMDRYLLAQTIIKEGLKTGDIIRLGLKEVTPPGFRVIDDFYGITETGRYAATEQAAHVLRNFYSMPLGSMEWGGLYRGYMRAGNALNQFQLMGPFHGGFVAGEAMASKAALGFKQLYRVLHGDSPMEAIKSFGETIVSPYTKYKVGSKMEAEYYKPNSQDPLVRQAVQDYIDAGMVFRMDKTLRTNQTEKMLSDWYNKRYGEAALRSPIALTEFLMKPIMQHLVPKVKAGAFEELMKEARRVYPNLAPEEYRSIARQIGNRIDARLGQVVYDRYFMRESAKGTIQAVIRAPGWSGGTITELGGAPVDALRFFKEMKDTKKLPSELPDRVAYALGLATIHSTINGLLTWLLTGEKPSGTDFWAFRTGVTDANGDPERGQIPTYGKDVYAYKTDTTRTLLHKIHPAVGLGTDLARNRDYYNTQIWTPEAPTGQQIGEISKYLMKAFNPFFIRAMIKNREQGADWGRTMLPNVGIMPAPVTMNQTPLERYLHEEYRNSLPNKPRTQEEFERAVLVNNYTKEIKKVAPNNAPLPEDLRQRIFADYESGKLTEKDLNRIELASEIASPVEKLAKKMSVEVLIRSWKRASDAEKEIMAPILADKADRLEQEDPNRFKNVEEALERIFPAKGGYI